MECSLCSQHQPICKLSPSGRGTHPRGELRDPVIRTRSIKNTILERTVCLHVSAEGNLVECEAALAVTCAERAHAVDDEAVILDRRLEALLAVPCPTWLAWCACIVFVPARHLQVMLMG